MVCVCVHYIFVSVMTACHLKTQAQQTLKMLQGKVAPVLN
jgi:hypothetical protein